MSTLIFASTLDFLCIPSYPQSVRLKETNWEKQNRKKREAHAGEFFWVPQNSVWASSRGHVFFWQWGGLKVFQSYKSENYIYLHSFFLFLAMHDAK